MVERKGTGCRAPLTSSTWFWVPNFEIFTNPSFSSLLACRQALVLGIEKRSLISASIALPPFSLTKRRISLSSNLRAALTPPPPTPPFFTKAAATATTAAEPRMAAMLSGDTGAVALEAATPPCVLDVEVITSDRVVVMVAAVDVVLALVEVEPNSDRP